MPPLSKVVEQAMRPPVGIKKSSVGVVSREKTRCWGVVGNFRNRSLGGKAWRKILG